MCGQLNQAISRTACVAVKCSSGGEDAVEDVHVDTRPPVTLYVITTIDAGHVISYTLS